MIIATFKQRSHNAQNEQKGMEHLWSSDRIWFYMVFTVTRPYLNQFGLERGKHARKTHPPEAYLTSLGEFHQYTIDTLHLKVLPWYPCMHLYGWVFHYCPSNMLFFCQLSLITRILDALSRFIPSSCVSSCLVVNSHKLLCAEVHQSWCEPHDIPVVAICFILDWYPLNWNQSKITIFLLVKNPMNIFTNHEIFIHMISWLPFFHE